MYTTFTSDNPNLKLCECKKEHKRNGMVMDCGTTINKKYEVCYQCLLENKESKLK